MNTNDVPFRRVSSVLLQMSLVVVLLLGFAGKSRSEERLKVAACQFPVGGNIESNADYVKRFIKEAASNKADIVQFSEAALSGSPPLDIPSFDNFDWAKLRDETHQIMSLARERRIWVVLGSAHYISEDEKPLNCLYIISDEGKIVDRYDKCMRSYGRGGVEGIQIGFPDMLRLLLPGDVQYLPAQRRQDHVSLLLQRAPQKQNHPRRNYPRGDQGQGLG